MIVNLWLFFSPVVAVTSRKRGFWKRFRLRIQKREEGESEKEVSTFIVSDIISIAEQVKRMGCGD